MLDFGEESSLKPEEAAPEKNKKAASLFDFISDISTNKVYLLDEGSEKGYPPFMVNRGLSQHLDTILLANEANKTLLTDKLMHHDFLFYVVPKAKRYGKWAKDDKENEELVQLMLKHYQVNRRFALQYLELLTEKDIESIKAKYDVGGRK